MLVAIVFENWDDPADHISLAVIQPKSLPLSLDLMMDIACQGELVIKQHIFISHQIIYYFVTHTLSRITHKETNY